MDFKTKVGELMSQGYKRASARAKIAHDVVLAAIKSSGMKDSVTIKGGRRDERNHQGGAPCHDGYGCGLRPLLTSE